MPGAVIQPASPGATTFLDWARAFLDQANAWTNWISVGSATVAQILAQVFRLPGDLPIRIAVAVVVFIAVGFLVWAWRMRRWKQSLPPLPAPPSPGRSPLLGPFPYEKGDHMYGRELEADQLFTVITGTAFRVGILDGPAGCGKTSLLRAGLLPLLESTPITPIYIAHCGAEPCRAVYRCLERIAAAGVPHLTGDLQARVATVASVLHGSLMIICDQLEEALGPTAPTQPCEQFIREVADCLATENPPASFLLCVRHEYHRSARAALDPLQAAVPYVPAQALGNFSPAVAMPVLRDAAQQSGLALAETLVAGVVADLTGRDITVWPAALQMVGQQLIAGRSQTAAQYIQAGRAPGMLAGTVGAAIEAASDPGIARSLLDVLTPSEGFSRNPTGQTFQQLVAHCISASGVDAAACETHVRRILRRFVGQYLLVLGPDGTYNLGGDFLIPAIRQALDATPATDARVVQANQALDAFLVAYRQNPQVRISGRTLRQIRKYALPARRATPQAKDLLAKSRWHAWLMRLRLPVAAFVLFAFPLILTNSGSGWYEADVLPPQVLANALAFDAPGRTLLVASTGNNGCPRIDAWDLPELTQHTLAPYRENCPDYYGVPPYPMLSVSPDNRVVAAMEQSGRVVLWRTGTWSASGDIPQPACRGMVAPAFSMDGKLLALGSQCSSIHLYSPTNLKLIRTLTTTAGKVVSAVAFSKSGGKVYALVDQTVLRWSVRGGQASRVPTSFIKSQKSHCPGDNGIGNLDALLMGPDDSPWVEVNYPCHLEWWDVGTRTLVATATWPSDTLHALIVSPETQQVAASDSIATIRAFNQGNGQRLRVVSVDRTSDIAAFSPDGTWLAVVASRVWLFRHGLYLYLFGRYRSVP